MQEEIELQISLNVGNKKYVLKIPRKGDLELLVNNFLQQNKINLKHQNAIVAMVQNKIQEEEDKNQQEETDPEPQKQDSEGSVEHNEPTNQEDANQSEQNDAVISHNKQAILLKLRVELQSDTTNPPDSRMVYEQWKLREKEKVKKQNLPLSSNQVSRLSKATKETLSPDHFYKKGLEFKQACDNHNESEFKKLYPFQLHDKQLKEQDKAKLFDRLCKKKKDNGVKNYLSGVGELEKGKIKPKYDEVKMKVKQYDDEVDRMLFGMIRNGELDYAKVRPKSKSPFRKTILY